MCGAERGDAEEQLKVVLEALFRNRSEGPLVTVA
jgi:hypothetical protein